MCLCAMHVCVISVSYAAYDESEKLPLEYAGVIVDSCYHITSCRGLHTNGRRLG